MKFLTKINRNFFMLFAAMLLFICIAGYFILQAMFLENARESLARKAVLIQNQIEKTGNLPQFDPLSQVYVIAKPTGKLNPSIKKIELFNSHEDELEPYAEYNKKVLIKGIYYNIQLREKTIEKDDLIFSLGVALFLLLVATFCISFFVNRRMNKTIWKGFEKNLLAIEQINFRNNEPLHLESTHINEFDRLNTIVYSLTNKLKEDYRSLKEFTENASHELQTPLAIISLNLEELLQQSMNEDAFKKTVSAINAVKRLSHLNQSLLLLAKIENNQFVALDEIAINEIVQRKLQELDPLFKAKKLHIELTVQSPFYWKINSQLVDILLNNMLSNAIHHNIIGGTILIIFEAHKLVICNTGEENNLTNENIFNRFVKGKSSSNGLGLAIVKQICETHHATISYEQTDLHCFTIITQQST
jgi:signal transduction histidine kinase